MVVTVERKRREAWIRRHSRSSFALPLLSCRLLSRVVLRIGRLEHASDIWLKIDFTFLGEVFGKDCLLQELRAHLFRSFRHEIHSGNDKNSHW